MSHRHQVNVTTYLFLLILSFVFFLDINECNGSHNCQHTCLNTKGSYVCSCYDSFILANDQYSCVPTCGGAIISNNGSIRTPGWPVFYPTLDFFCTWTFQTDNNTIIDFVFDEQFGIGGGSPCRTDYVQLLDGIGGNSRSLGKFCYLTVPPPITTTGNQGTVIFKGSSRQHTPDRIGFSITFSAIKLGASLIQCA